MRAFQFVPTSLRGMRQIRSVHCGLTNSSARQPQLLLRTAWSARPMSSSATPALRHTFVVYAPDMTDEGAFRRRLSVRQAHLDRAGEQVRAGVVSESLCQPLSCLRRMVEMLGYVGLAGAMLTPESIASPTAEKKMVGSVFVCEAESLDTVKTLMENDVYYTSGVVSYDQCSRRRLKCHLNMI